MDSIASSARRGNVRFGMSEGTLKQVRWFVCAALTLWVAAVGWSCSARTKSSTPIINRYGMKFVEIPLGSYWMGNLDKPDERPVHRVTFASSLWLQTMELTQAQWKAVMGTHPWSGVTNMHEGDDYPASMMTWPDAQQFIKKLNELDPGHGYRLPSEAEWEYACRAGSTGTYGFGNDRNQLRDYAWFDANASKVGESYAHLVGQKKPNAWGLFDMHGNVWEWCQDSYQDSYQGAPTNGAARVMPDKDSHVYRGGSFRNAERFARTSARAGLDEGDYNDNIGFRVVMQSAGAR